MPLASTTQYEAITGQTSDARVEALLDLASAAVVDAAGGQQIASGTVTAEVIRPWMGIGHFAQRPVTAVASVAWNIPGVSAVTLSAADYRWESGGHGRPARLIRQVAGVDALWSGTDVLWPSGVVASGAIASTLTVTYTAGWATVPAQIVSLVVSMVKNVIDTAGGPTATTETLGAASFSYDGAQLPPGAFLLTDAQQAMLDGLVGLKGGATSVPARAGG